jgi:16S rRNA (guanine527-N7)-methyltransferase
MSEETRISLLLEQGLKQFNLTSLHTPLLHYLVLLNKWNVAYNLTAIRDLESMISKHILDSLAILPWIKGEKLLDVGTGAGLPGIPLAIARPDLRVVLLDSNGKKIRFLHEVKRQLKLKNVELVQLRAETYQPTTGFDTVTSRAFSNIEQMIHWTQHLVAKDGIWLAMKGVYPHDELDKITQSYQVEQYQVSGIDGERCCVIIKNTTKE